LDVGVSDVISSGSNILEWRYPYKDRITAVGLGEGIEFRSTFPEIAYLQISNGLSLPFDDRCFDIVTSNAVLEHLGSVTNQKLFIEELLRVGSNVFITVPNRYFPVEHHTAIPLMHFFDVTFSLACSLTGKQEWANSENLIMISKRSLAMILPEGVSARVHYTGLNLGPWSSNILVGLQCSNFRAAIG
jgi:2-polyprenyl-3-methyl-5-hydroxy-6-metoxy-1,4-benzoquinol methylase